MSATPHYRVDDEHSGEYGREVRVFGPPGCLDGATSIGINRAGKGGTVRLDHLVTCFNGGKPAGRGARLWDLSIPTYVQRAVGDTVRLGRLLNAWESGVKPVWELRTEGGRIIVATDEHPFLTPAGWAKLGDLRVGDAVLVDVGQGRAGRGLKPQYADTYTRYHPRQRRGKGGWRVPTHRLVAEAMLNGLPFGEYVDALRTDPERCATFTYLTPDQTVHHRNHDHRDNRPENLVVLAGGQAEHADEHGWGDNVLAHVGADRIVSLQPAADRMTFDLEVADDPHCFIANGIVVHNTGKTTYLTGSVRATAHARGPRNVVVASFTTTAAAELGSRGLPLPKSQIGTLHSLAYRELDRPPVADEQIADWNDRHPAYARSVKSGKVNLDDGTPVEAGAGGATEGDALASRLDALRARMVPPEDYPADVAAFARTWEAWKRDTGTIDFTDMIELALEQVPRAPGDPDVGFFDETQDFTPLELSLIRKWGQHMERIILAGDDDQASLPGTMVLTAHHGEVAIEHLDPAVHTLVSWRADQRRLQDRRGQGYPFAIAAHVEHGTAITLATSDGRTTRCTSDHRTVARWAPELWAANPHVVYLMRRGGWWRIGRTRMQVSRSFGVRMRMHGEKAEQAWVLAVTTDEGVAIGTEQGLAARFGLPTVTFEARGDDSVQPLVFGQDIDWTERAEALLAHLQLDPQQPFVTRGEQQWLGGHGSLKLRAVNLIPEAMEVPVNAAGASEWSRLVGAERMPYVGPAYSLEVDQLHHYVADGIVTRNCLYGFKGATPDSFLNPPIPDHDKIILSQSYRIPASVHRAAEHWIDQIGVRQPKVYLPRDEEGAVRHAAGVHYLQPQRVVAQVEAALETTSIDGDGVERPTTVMVLATCGYMLDKVKHELRSRGLPFHNPYRRTRGDWNPLRASGRGISSKERLISYLRIDDRPEMGLGDLSRPWTGEDIRRWAHVIKKSGIFHRGIGSVLEALPDRELDWPEVAALFADQVEMEQAVTPDLRWFERNLLAASRAGMAFPIEVARKRGPQALIAEPRVVLGTIHSVKGGQADVVILIPDLSMRGAGEWAKVGPTRDGVVRQMYVGMTRARHELVVCDPATTTFVPPDQIIAGARAAA